MGLRVSNNQVVGEAAAMAERKKTSVIRQIDAAKKSRSGDEVELSEQARQQLRQLALVETGPDKDGDVARARLRLGSQLASDEVAVENHLAARVRPQDLAEAERALERVLEGIRTSGRRAVDAQSSRLFQKKTRLPMD